MQYITVAEFESPGGVVTCKIQGLSTQTTADFVNFIKYTDIKYSSEANFFEMDTQGVTVLNKLSKPNFNYRVISQSTVIEISDIGSRTDKVQKTIWTLGKQ